MDDKGSPMLSRRVPGNGFCRFRSELCRGGSRGGAASGTPFLSASQSSAGKYALRFFCGFDIIRSQIEREVPVMPEAGNTYNDFIVQTVRDALLQRLLMGRAREVEGLPELLTQFQICFASEQFAVLGLRLCGEGRSGGDWTPPPEPNFHKLAEDFLGSAPGWDAWCLLHDDLFFAVLCRNGAGGAAPLALGQGLVRCLESRHPAVVAVSQEKQGLGGINDGYYEVLEVMGVLDMRGSENVALCFSDLDAAAYQTMDTTFERDRRLINSVLEGNRGGTLTALAQMESSGALDGRNTLMLEKRRLLGLVNQMTAEITSGGDVDFLTELDAYRKLMNAPAAEQLTATFRAVTLGLCGYFSGAQADLGTSRALRIADYIDRHYADPELSIDSLSAIFKISPSYLSRIFKREKGVGVLPYLQNKRIAQARVLLASTQLRIRQIALQVGFFSDQTFTRTFKSLTGVTPSAYREARR